MRKRLLGKSSIEISEIALGSWLTYAGGIEREQTQGCTRAAFDLGITFFDTANVYGQGAAEEAWGEFLNEYSRDDYVLATKLRAPMPKGQGSSPEQVRLQPDGSLRWLKTDHVDLYQLHRWDKNVPVADTLGALTDAVPEGKVRAIGFSEWTPEQIDVVLAVPDVARFATSQPQYWMLWRAPEQEVFPFCAANSISQIVWSSPAEGVLTGKYRPGGTLPPGSRAATPMADSGLIRDYMAGDALEALQRLRPIATGLGISMTQLALAWVLRQTELAAAIVGASRPEQLADSAGASGVTLDPSTLDAIEEALGGAGVREPRLGIYADPELGASVR